MKKLILVVAASAVLSSCITAGLVSHVMKPRVTQEAQQKIVTRKVNGTYRTLRGSLNDLAGKLTQMDKATVAKAATKKPTATKKPSGGKGESSDIKELNNSGIFEWVDSFTGVHYLVYSIQREEAGMGGITPRLNADQSIMTDDYKIGKR